MLCRFISLSFIWCVFLFHHNLQRRQLLNYFKSNMETRVKAHCYTDGMRLRRLNITWSLQITLINVVIRGYEQLSVTLSSVLTHCVLIWDGLKYVRIALGVMKCLRYNGLRGAYEYFVLCSVLSGRVDGPAGRWDTHPPGGQDNPPVPSLLSRLPINVTNVKYSGQIKSSVKPPKLQDVIAAMTFTVAFRSC